MSVRLPKEQLTDGNPMSIAITWYQRKKQNQIYEGI